MTPVSVARFAHDKREKRDPENEVAGYISVSLRVAVPVPSPPVFLPGVGTATRSYISVFMH